MHRVRNHVLRIDVAKALRRDKVLLPRASQLEQRGLQWLSDQKATGASVSGRKATGAEKGRYDAFLLSITRATRKVNRIHETAISNFQFLLDDRSPDRAGHGCD